MKLPAHPIEIENLKERWLKIVEAFKKAGFVIVTHYHYDHFNPDQFWYYQNKIVFLKNPDEKINLSQKRRGKEFLKLIQPLAKEIYMADGKKFSFGYTRIEFSKPVFHGPMGRMGYVIEVSVSFKNETFLFTSDIQGPFDDTQMEFIVSHEPQVIYIDPPPVYLLKQAYPVNEFEKSLLNLKRLLGSQNLETLIIDHHPLRIVEWPQYFSEILKDPRVKTSAGYLGQQENLLEARRRSLYFGDSIA